MRKPGFEIARTRLIIGKRAVRCRAAGEKPLRQRNLRQPAEPLNPSELQRAREHDVLADRMIRRVAHQQPRELGLRPKLLQRDAHVDRVVHPAMRIDRIVAAVLNEGHREHAHPLRLREQRDQLRRNHDVAEIVTRRK